MNKIPFFAGVGKRSIPYPENFFPYRAWGPRCLTGVHDDLCVRALYLSSPAPLLFAAVEAGEIDWTWQSKLADAVGLAPDRIFLSATHTHTAPYIGGYWEEEVRDREKSAAYAQNAWQTVLETVRDAMQKTEPVSARFREGSCGINVNRDVWGRDPFTGEPSYTTGKNRHGPSDKTVSVLQFVREDGSTMAVLFGYPVHSSVLFGPRIQDGGQLASGDIAGSAMAQVEQALDCTALFAMSPAADQNPRFTGDRMTVDANGHLQMSDYGMGCFALVDVQAAELSAEVVRLCRQDGSSLLPELSACTDVVWIPGKVKREGPRIPAPKSPKDYEPSDPVPVPVSAAFLGDVLVVGIGCEITSVIGQELRRALGALGHSKIYIITQCNGASSYMADDDAYERVTFTAKASHMMPGASNRLTEGICRLVKRL